MSTVSTGRPGRPAAAAREDVLALAADRFFAGERVDMQGIARELGLARATMHRWFGTREVLLGEMLAKLAEDRLALIRSQTSATGARGLLDCFDRFSRNLTATKGLGVWLGQEQERALRILTSSGGIVQPRVVAAIERLIDAEVQAGTYVPTLAPPTLAYTLVRLGESFIYNDAMFGIRGDTQRLREVDAALLGVD
ncbi:MAG TPA: QsdR family transcriptional regulator [Solirubrobacteraceae bacterium]|nr:QsdR family transcriptional regulator [Solirubrobacteraceae bacterium]